MRIVCISDTHCTRPAIPDGDVLIHAGDLTMMGRFQEVTKECFWLKSLPHKLKFLIAGNHDWIFEKDNGLGRVAVGTGITYLQDSMGFIPIPHKDSLKVWGSPWQPRFCDWAFNVDRGEAIKKKWAKIPVDIDILVTHGPPRGILDGGMSEAHIGCDDLLVRVKQLKPKLHIFGHSHVGHGVHEEDGTTFINAAIGYGAEHKPIVIDI